MNNISDKDSFFEVSHCQLHTSWLTKRCASPKVKNNHDRKDQNYYR